jgi:hypothetical protein
VGVDRVVAMVLLSMAAPVVAFFAPFLALRLRPANLKPVATAILSVVAAAAVLYAIERAGDLDGDSALLLLALALLPLGVAAGAREGWRFVAPAGGALGLVVLALLAWGALHPPMEAPEHPGHQIPPPPPIAPFTWTVLLAGNLLVLVPRRWAVAVAAALLWIALVGASMDARLGGPSELARVVPMLAPALVTLAAVLSAAIRLRKQEAPSTPEAASSP